MQGVRRLGTLQVISCRSLPVAQTEEIKRLKFYAVLIGDDPGNRTAFVHRGSPVQLATKGLVAVLSSALTRVENPIFAFRPEFDVVISPSGVFALNQKSFEALFKDSEPVLAKTSQWVEELSAVLPVESASKAYLADRLKANVHLRRKVQAILKKPHLHRLTTVDLVSAMQKHDLEPSDLIQNEELVFSSSTEREILQLLNEDLFKGDFSGDRYAASKKSPRPGS
ncbi:Kiwa anti-phage protein KwaB-like domain-containing protein [Actinoplanes subglobosus]|uniref:Kiwa anti-phage protein KwaB-like domain-containing protein n=1 Tax=Actinoplanes subglobosus TaxID=1547892 RepID=A0ABV8J2C3_9ACTN